MSRGLKIIFAGTPVFATAALQSLLASRHQIIAVYTQPDRPAGRGQKLCSSAVKRLALQAKIPVFQPTAFDTDECARLQALDADVMLVSAYGLLLPVAVLETPKSGCINVHASLLPQWRGAAPIQRALLAGAKQTGITIIQMVKELDAGPILHQSTCDVRAADTGLSVHDRLAQLSASHIVDILNDLQNNALTPIPQDASRATYASKLTKQEANINWHASARTIERKIRAFNAWPVAYTYLQGKRLRVWQAALSDTISQRTPGTIIAATKNSIEVATGEGVISLHSLQLSGGKIIDARDFINARNVLDQRFSSKQ